MRFSTTFLLSSLALASLNAALPLTRRNTLQARGNKRPPKLHIPTAPQHPPSSQHSNPPRTPLTPSDPYLTQRVRQNLGLAPSSAPQHSPSSPLTPSDPNLTARVRHHLSQGPPPSPHSNSPHTPAGVVNMPLSVHTSSGFGSLHPANRDSNRHREQQPPSPQHPPPSPHANSPRTPADASLMPVSVHTSSGFGSLHPNHANRDNNRHRNQAPPPRDGRQGHSSSPSQVQRAQRPPSQYIYHPDGHGPPGMGLPPASVSYQIRRRPVPPPPARAPNTPPPPYSFDPPTS